MKMVKYFITGGAGFIGSNYIRYLVEQGGCEILNYDKLTYAGNLYNLKGLEERFDFVQADICNIQKLNETFEKFQPDVVINFAAESHVDRSIKDSSQFIKTNVLGTDNLLKCSLKHDVGKYVQISTDEVYGTLGTTGLFTENTPLNPSNPYSASKAAADHLVRTYVKTYKINAAITRCTNNYGPRQHTEKLIPTAIDKTLKKQKIPVYGDGLNIRDWIHVNDHCKAIQKIVENDTKETIYNIGAENEWKNIDLVKKIIQIIAELKPELGVDENLIEFVKDRPGHDLRYAIDPKRIQKEFKWKAKTSFEKGLKETIKWYLG